MLEEINASVQRGESFAFETTLAGRGYRARIDDWRSRGYQVSLFILSLPDEDAAIERVAERMRQGGHDIPEAVIGRRFIAGWRNFHDHYKNRVGTWALYNCKNPEPLTHGLGRKHMSRQDISQAKSPELRGSLAAMRRAGELARQRAIQTNTNLVVVEDGKAVRVLPDQLGRETQAQKA